MSSLRDLVTPASEDSAFPQLAGDGKGGVFMTWGEPFLVNTDGKKAEHGFASFAPTAKGMAVVWLDGRQTKGSHEGDHAAAGGGAMTLRFVEFMSDGTRVRESLLDAKVCDCCQTAVVNTSKGLLAAYRDRSDPEFHDISLVRPEALKPEPRDFSKDGWKINACPVNGPALAARGDAVAAAWFTMVGGMLIAPRYAVGGLAAMVVAMAAQGRGHALEPRPAAPFRGSIDVAVRIMAEQWISFPRFVLDGGFARAWRSLSRRAGE